MWYCAKCGTENSNDARFCPNCGNKGPERKTEIPKTAPAADKHKKSNNKGCLPLLVIVVLFIIFVSNGGFGLNKNKQNSLEAAVELWSDVVQIEADEGVLVGLTGQGRVYLAMDEENGLEDAQAWKDIVQISLHRDMLLGLDNKGKVWLATKGDNMYLDSSDLAEWPEMRVVQAGDNAAYGIDFGGALHIAGDQLLDPYGPFYDEYYGVLGSRDKLANIDVINAMSDSDFYRVFGQGFADREELINYLLRWSSVDDLDYNKFCLAGVSYLGDSFAHYFSYSNNYIMPELYGEVPGDVEFGPDNCLMIHTINDSTFLAVPTANNPADTSWYDSVLLGACDAVWGGERHVVARKLDGSTVACGDNSYGQCDVAMWKNVEDAALCDTATFAVVDGKLVAAGQMNWDGKIVIFK